MNTIYTTLPLYDNPDKRDSSVNVLRWSPRHRLPSFLAQRAASSDKIKNIKLVDRAGTETDIIGYMPSDNPNVASSWTDGGLATTFVNDTCYFDITLNTGTINVVSNSINVSTGVVILVKVNAKTVSGTIDTANTKIYIYSGAAIISNQVALSTADGITIAVLTATDTDASSNIYITTTATADSTQWQACATFQVLSDPLDEKSLTTYDYLQYKNWVLNKPLTAGEYYLKINDGKKYWFSDWFTVADIYSNLITGWTNSGCERLVTSGTRIVSLKNQTSSGIANSNAFTVYADEKIIVEFPAEVVAVSDVISINLADPVNGTISNVGTIADGSNSITLTATYYSASAFVCITIAPGETGTMTAGDFTVRRNTPDDLLHIEFYNGSDLGNILYQDGFQQNGWLKGFVKRGKHVTEQEGEERDGEYLMEKVVTKHEYSAKVHVTENIHRALQLLPNHATCTIRYNTRQYDCINVKVQDVNWYDQRGLLEVNFSTSPDVFVQRGNLTNMT